MGDEGLIHTPTLHCMSPGPSGHLVHMGLHGFLGPLNVLPLAILAHCRSRRDGVPLVQDIPECSPQLLVRVSWKYGDSNPTRLLRAQMDMRGKEGKRAVQGGLGEL